MPPESSRTPGSRGGVRAPSSCPLPDPSRTPAATCPCRQPALLFHARPWPQVSLAPIQPLLAPGRGVLGRAWTTTKAESGAWLGLGSATGEAPCFTRTRATRWACAPLFLLAAHPNARDRHCEKTRGASQCPLKVDEEGRGGGVQERGRGPGPACLAFAHTQTAYSCSARGDPWLGRQRQRQKPSLGPAIPDPFRLPPKLQVTAPTPRNPRFS